MGPIESGPKSTWYQDNLKQTILDAGVIKTTLHHGNENVVIRIGFANGKHTLMVTYSGLATATDRINDPDAYLVLYKTYKDVKHLNAWIQSIERINRMSLRKLQAMTKQASDMVLACTGRANATGKTIPARKSITSF